MWPKFSVKPLNHSIVFLEEGARSKVKPCPQKRNPQEVTEAMLLGLRRLGTKYKAQA